MSGFRGFFAGTTRIAGNRSSASGNDKPIGEIIVGRRINVQHERAHGIAESACRNMIGYASGSGEGNETLTIIRSSNVVVAGDQRQPVYGFAGVHGQNRIKVAALRGYDGGMI